MTKVFHAMLPEWFGRISGVIVINMLGGSLRELQGPAIVVLVASREVALNDVHTRWLVRRGCISAMLGYYSLAYSVLRSEYKSKT